MPCDTGRPRGKIHDCEIYGGAKGFGCLNFGANYALDIHNCKLGGEDCCIHLYFTSSARISNVFLDKTWRVGIRMVEGVEASIRGVFTPSYGLPEFIIKATKSMFDLSNMVVDNEDPFQGCQIACIYVSPHYALPISSWVKIERVYVGSSGANTPFLILDDRVPEDGVGETHALVEVDTVMVPEQERGPFVRTNGPRWHGRIRADNDFPRQTWIENTGTSSNVVVDHCYYIGPPRDSTWVKNSHLLKVLNPALGQFSEWRCVASGSYGTASPPTWLGMNPIDDGLSLAAYVPGHTYWSAAGAPAGSQGAWGNGLSSISINAIFGGTMPTPPAQVYAAVLSRWSTRSRYFLEIPFVNGYARVAVPGSSWSSSSGGVINNSSAITFPTAAGAWNYYGQTTTLPTLAFFNAATGGQVLAQVDITPALIGSGDTLGFAPGAISIQPCPASAQGSFAGTVHDLVNNLWLKAQAFAPPAIYLALSTAPAGVTTPPTEPAGGGYARVATSAASWTRSQNAVLTSNGATGTTAALQNARPLTFPAPTADSGTARSVYLMDAASGGNILAAANLTISRVIAAGSPARSFAPESLWISV